MTIPANTPSPEPGPDNIPPVPEPPLPDPQRLPGTFPDPTDPGTIPQVPPVEEPVPEEQPL